MRLWPILAICVFAAAAVAATCVTRVEEQGAFGPWVGETVNTGPTTVHDTSVHARILDGTGRELAPGRPTSTADVCPSTLLPGEHGAFELGAVPDPEEGGMPVMPLRPAFLPATESQGPGALRSAGLFAEIVNGDPTAHEIDVKITNNSTTAYYGVSVCAIVRSAPDGNAFEVVFSSAAAAVDTDLRPGASATRHIVFRNPPSGRVQLYPSGTPRTALECYCAPGSGAGYRVVDARTFTAVLPDDWAYNPLQGIDSFVAEFVGDGATLFFDHGGYSAPPPAIDDPAYTITRETIGGFAAHIVVPRTAAGDITGVFFIDDLTYNGQPILFNLIGTDLTPAQQGTALQIFRSIRFDPGSD